MNDRIINGVRAYYTSRVDQYGNTPLGVDWNSKASQYLRFQQLCKVIQPDEEFSIIDYGCGYGELINYLLENFEQSLDTYLGYDLSEKMIECANKTFIDKNASFYTKLPDVKADYLVASGIFNVKLDLATDEEWDAYLQQLLISFNDLSMKGFSFNLLTVYSDPERMKSHLFYADPMTLFDFCKKNFSRNVALLHDYDLYEFTIIVRK